MTSPRYVSPSMLARMLGIEPSAISNRIARGTLVPDEYVQTGSLRHTPIFTRAHAEELVRREV